MLSNHVYTQMLPDLSCLSQFLTNTVSSHNLLFSSFTHVLCFCFIYSLYIPFTAHFSTPPSLIFPHPFLHSISTSQIKGALSPHNSPTHHVSAELRTSSPSNSRQASPTRGRGSKDRELSPNQGEPLLQLLGDPHEDQAAQWLQM